VGSRLVPVSPPQKELKINSNQFLPRSIFVIYNFQAETSSPSVKSCIVFQSAAVLMVFGSCGAIQLGAELRGNCAFGSQRGVLVFFGRFLLCIPFSGAVGVVIAVVLILEWTGEARRSRTSLSERASAVRKERAPGVASFTLRRPWDQATLQRRFSTPLA